MPRAPVCPFFERARNAHLSCVVQGADAEHGGKLQMEFPTPMCRVQYWARYCCGDWKGCRLSATLWEEYEKEQQTAVRPQRCAHRTAKGGGT